MATQLPLAFPSAENWQEDDFFVSSCNEAAFRTVKAWRDWTSPVTILTGPASSGKSHLARIWTADVLGAAGGPVANAPSGEVAYAVFEDVDRTPYSETGLFHALNSVRELRGRALLTARTPPGTWTVTLPDLRSRLRSYPVTAIEEPDGGLLAAVLIKHLSDRGLPIAPDVAAFLLARAERSMAAVEALAERLDYLSLSERRRITKRFAAEVLKQSGA
jgi:chromosomal replication initiation ATPase DnaA